ncbi:hypothetical protein GGF31_001447 [Allomyces arbusculus]|nr:hypothetical protein GGF31_001447 [Allomyces arbusculus]
MPSIALAAHWQGSPDTLPVDLSPAPTWTVTTRYYTARVKPALIPSPAPAHEVHADAEALVVAAALDASLSADRVAALVATWPWTAWDAHPAETKLVISTSTDGSTAGDAALEDAAQEHGFETVFWRQTEPRDQWDRVGAARLVDALEATMWRSMRVHDGGAGAPPRLADTTAHLLNGTDHHDSSSDDDDDDGDDDDGAHDATAPLPNTVPSAHPTSNDDDDDDDDWTAFHAPDHRTHSAADVDRDLDALDAVFARLARVRATPHDADPAHRRAAAESAMRALWGVLGDDSDDDEDEDVFASVARQQR